MSNATKIIKANDLIALAEKIETLDLLCLMRITKKSLGLCRKDCFHLIYQYSKKFINDPLYYKDYLLNVFNYAGSNNNLFVLELLLSDKDNNIDIDDKTFNQIIQFNDVHYRILKFLLENKKINDYNFYLTLCKIMLNNYKNSVEVMDKKIKLLTQYMSFDSKKFLLVLKRNQLYRRVEQYNPKREYYNLFSFLKKYDNEKWFLTRYSFFEPYMNEHEQNSYIQHCLKEKISEF